MILVTGAPRSGKAMIAGILRLTGVFAGRVNKMEENTAIQKISHRQLENYSYGKYDIVDLPFNHNWRDMIHQALYFQGRKTQRWMYKGSDIASNWHQWDRAYPSAKWVIVRRKKEDIVNSCMKTAHMDAFDNEKDWGDLVDRYNVRLKEITENVNCCVVWPERMARGDYSQVFEMLDYLDLKWTPKILEYIDPKFWKVRCENK